MIKWQKPGKFDKADPTKRDYRITLSFTVYGMTEREALWKGEVKRRQLVRTPRRQKRVWDETIGRYTYIKLPATEANFESLEEI